MNRYLTYQDGELLFEDVPLSEIAQEMYTPFYVYSKAAILEKVEAFKQAFADIKPMMAFSMKALDTTLILKILQERGCSLEVSNLNEMQRALAIGFPPTSIIFNSYGLSDNDIKDVLKQKPLLINTGNIFELEPLNRYAAEMDIGVRIGLRVGLGIEVDGFHGKNVPATESRIGIRREEMKLAFALAEKLPQLNLTALSCHIGSQVSTLAPWIKMSEEMAKLFNEATEKGFHLEYLDLGGGFPVAYSNEEHLEIKKIARNIVPHVKDLDCRVILEPGRYFTAEAGVLVTSVLGVKDVNSKFYVICDAGLPEFPRPAIFRTNHEIAHLREPEVCKTEIAKPFVEGESEDPTDVATAAAIPDPGELFYRQELPNTYFNYLMASGNIGTGHSIYDPVTADLVGPSNDGMDYIARGVNICVPKRGDLLAVLNTGAYGRTMSSNYASRFRPPEILIERDKFEIVRSREVVDDLIALDLEESEIEA